MTQWSSVDWKSLQSPRYVAMLIHFDNGLDDSVVGFRSPRLWPTFVLPFIDLTFSGLSDTWSLGLNSCRLEQSSFLLLFPRMHQALPAHSPCVLFAPLKHSSVAPHTSDTPSPSTPFPCYFFRLLASSAKALRSSMLLSHRVCVLLILVHLDTH